MKTLRLILGDQLTHSLPILREVDTEQDKILMMEVWDEAKYVPHHPKKIAFLFSAMRHFHAELCEKNLPADYIKLTSSRSLGSFSKTIENYLDSHKFEQILVTEPGEWRVQEELKELGKKREIPVAACRGTGKRFW